VDLGNRTLFFDLWIKDLPEEAARRLIASSGDIALTRLESIRRFKPYNLERSGGKNYST